MTDWVDSLESSIRRGRNRDGGWGYYAGKESRLEPTCWALLAQAGSDPEVLRTWPAKDGLLLERSGGEPNFAFHGLGLLTLLVSGTEHRLGNSALVYSLQNARGVQLKQSEYSTQNNSLQGWSWFQDTFSWVEPTAWCLIALKKSLTRSVEIDRKRLAEAEAMLLDRSCAEGGWNYGTSNVLGKQHPAYVPTTAVALLALQDRKSDPLFKRGLDYLKRSSESEPSSVALSLACMTLGVLGEPTEAVASALSKQLPAATTLGNQCAQALALFALRRDHDYAPLRI